MEFRNLFGLFKKKEGDGKEIKSLVSKDAGLVKKSSSFFEIDPSTFRSSLDTGFGFSQSIPISDFIRFYLNIAPVFTSIEIKAREIQSIVPRVFDTKRQEFLDNHPILELLNKPNKVDTRQTFIGALQRFFDITGNAFYIAIGRIERPPLELFVQNPTHILIDPHGRKARVTSHHRSEDFFAFDVESGGDFGIRDAIRFGEQRMVNSERLKEIFHHRNFNPISSFGSFGDEPWGTSKLNAINSELMQFLALNSQNFNIIRQGAVPPIWFLPINDLSDDQKKAFKKEINAYLNGEGSALVAEGMTKDQIFETSRKEVDMNFGELRKRLVETIFRQFDIPLAKVLPEQMTLANMESATLNLYDNAIIPDTKLLFQKLTKDLMPRFENSENLELRFITTDIPALRFRAIEEVLKLSKTFTMTQNELRKHLGLKDVEEGDDVYIPKNLIPMLKDIVTIDSLAKPLPKSEKMKFIELLKNQSLENGKALISEKEAKDLAEEYF